jgi:hemerythrin
MAEENQRIRAEHRQALYTLRQTQGAYGRFVPKDFIRLLGADDILNVRLGDEVEKKITIMFTDIRNFTSLSEDMTSRETFEFLNTYLSQMEPPVQRHGGIIDKFIGDAVMALFPDRAENAVKAAISMRTALAFYNGRRVKNGQEPIQMGIGLNTGLTTLGILGHLERMESTVIGDAVNVAQRIEGLTKNYRVGTLISEDTLASLGDPHEFSFRFVDRVRVKGRARPISVYEVFDGEDTEGARAKLESIDVFERAVAYYHLREVDRARPLFEICQKASPDDTVVDIYLERCRTFLENGVYEGVGELCSHMEWRESFNTGMEDIDRQHGTLLENINALAGSIQNEDAKAIEKVFSFLEEYSVDHFHGEESLMEEYEYPFIAEHRQEHSSFIRAFTANKQEIMSGRHERLLSLFRINLFLYDWLISHSTRVDKHLALFIQARRQRRS